jgi:hypothetical protein
MKEKQLRLVNANFLNNLYKGDYDNVFYSLLMVAKHLHL